MRRLLCGQVTGQEIFLMTTRNNLARMIFTVGLTLSVLSNHVFGEELVKLSESENGTVSYYDRESVRESISTMKVWITTKYGNVDKKIVINELKKDNRCLRCEKLSYSRSSYDIDCKENRIQINRVIIHGENNEILFVEFTPTDWLNIIPGTVFDELKSVVCK